MSLTGTLETFQLSSLLQLLSADQKTGVLHIAEENNEARIFMKDGVIVYASSSKQEHRLGHLLVTEGMVSEGQLNTCLKLAQQKGEKLGRTLLQEGHVSLETLKRVLHHQVKEVLCSLFLWKKGRFAFHDSPLKVDEQLVTKMNTMEVILEASRRIDEWSIIKTQIASDLWIFKISQKTQDKNEVNLNRIEWRVLSLVDGNRTVREVVDQSGCDEFSAFKSLCSLQLSGLIEKTEQKARGDAKKREDIDYPLIINIYYDVFQVVYQDLKTQLGKSVIQMMDACKAQLLPEQRRMFDGFDLEKGAQENTQAVLGGMDMFTDREKGGPFLIHSFTTLFQFLLEKESSAVGFKLTQQTLQEVTKTLSYIREYRKGSVDILGIVEKIETIVGEVGRKAREPKAKQGGLSGLFKGN